MKILLVGGTWTSDNIRSENEPTPHASSIVNKIEEAILHINELQSEIYYSDIECVTKNGGNFSDLSAHLQLAKNADITIWMPNVPDNDLPKFRDVKSVAPHTILITSKRNDNEKYNFGEVVRRALGTKSNLLIEFSKKPSGIFHMSIIDPLGNEWYSGVDIHDMVKVLIKRATQLKNITRQGTIQSNIENVQQMPEDVNNFVNIVQTCGKVFAEYTPSADNTTRLLGNCSTANPTRCSKGFPTMRGTENIIFVSQRNVDKKALTVENLVPVSFDGKIIKYAGENKPSVDTPIQVRLYDLLPNINYMIHSHCYIKGAPFTETCIPCGGLEEVEEVMKVIDSSLYERDTMFFTINLKGHGSLVMAYNTVLLDGIEKDYYPREFPEKQY